LSQVRAVIERSGSFLNAQGQLPHHFDGIQPIFVALSGATMLGPNVFWALSALNYAKNTGNLQWLTNYMPTLRHASAFMFGERFISFQRFGRSDFSLNSIHDFVMIGFTAVKLIQHCS
jgi:hypothetical protein